MFGLNKKKQSAMSAQSNQSDAEIEKAYHEGLASVIDLIAPAALQVTTSHIQIGDTYGRTIFASEISKS